MRDRGGCFLPTTAIPLTRSKRKTEGCFFQTPPSLQTQGGHFFFHPPLPRPKPEMEGTASSATATPPLPRSQSASRRGLFLLNRLPNPLPCSKCKERPSFSTTPPLRPPLPEIEHGRSISGGGSLSGGVVVRLLLPPLPRPKSSVRARFQVVVVTFLLLPLPPPRMLDFGRGGLLLAPTPTTPNRRRRRRSAKSPKRASILVSRHLLPAQPRHDSQGNYDARRRAETRRKAGRGPVTYRYFPKSSRFFRPLPRPSRPLPGLPDPFRPLPPVSAHLPDLPLIFH